MAALVLASITHLDSAGQPLVGHEYAYNDSGLIETYENSTDGTSDYGYDPTGQLISADHETQPDEQYAYDANGNRIDYAVGPANQVLCDGVYWYAYDNEGHRTERYQWIDADGDGKADREEKFDRTQYAWDARGRLVKIVTKPDGQTKSRVVHYDYDYQNRRVEKIVNDFDSDGEKTKTVERYLYTGQDIVLQTDQRGEVTHRYLHGPAVDQCLADERVLDDNILYPLFDNLGTIRDIADHDPATGQTRIVNHLVYSVYGEILSQTDPTQSTLFGFTGREIDPESDLYHYRGRYYAIALHQFLSEDPLSFWAGDPNPRRYCGNSPTNRTDPSGLVDGVDIKFELQLRSRLPKQIPAPSMPIPTTPTLPGPLGRPDPPQVVPRLSPNVLREAMTGQILPDPPAGTPILRSGDVECYFNPKRTPASNYPVAKVFVWTAAGFTWACEIQLAFSLLEPLPAVGPQPRMPAPSAVLTVRPVVTTTGTYPNVPGTTVTTTSTYPNVPGTTVQTVGVNPSNVPGTTRIIVQPRGGVDAFLPKGGDLSPPVAPLELPPVPPPAPPPPEPPLFDPSPHPWRWTPRISSPDPQTEWNGIPRISSPEDKWRWTPRFQYPPEREFPPPFSDN